MQGGDPHCKPPRCCRVVAPVLRNLRKKIKLKKLEGWGGGRSSWIQLNMYNPAFLSFSLFPLFPPSYLLTSPLEELPKWTKHGGGGGIRNLIQPCFISYSYSKFARQRSKPWNLKAVLRIRFEWLFTQTFNLFVGFPLSVIYFFVIEHVPLNARVSGDSGV